jgi:hypothetical protein
MVGVETMSVGFYHQVNGYWETTDTPSQEVIDAYPVGTIEVPLRPSDAYAWENGQWVYVGEPQNTAEENKSYAMYLLQQTDWVNQPDVRDVNNDPHLLNGDEFDAYRLQLRKIAVTPVAGNIVFPTIPQERWGI